MSMDFLQREAAPFGAEVWAKIDETVVGAAKSQLTARRLLEIEGPYGLALKGVPGPDHAVAGEGASLSVSSSVPVPSIEHGFSIPMRDIANFEQTGLPFDLSSVAEAAIACANREDDLVFNGLPDLGIPGLLKVEGGSSVELQPWNTPGDAFANVMEAVNVLDDRGLHGPYALALTPSLYNGLFRLYPEGGPTEMEQLQMLATGGIIKAPALNKGGILVAVGKQYLSLVVGQDLVTAFVGPQAGSLEFCLMESLVLKVSLARAICALS